MASSAQSSAPPPHAAVTGLQWGDEGKGKIVDLLAADHDVIVRYNGGANAGHSVVIGEKRYALHLVPCGILTPGRLNLIGNGVVVDPPLLLEEIASLRAAGVTVDQNLRLSERAHVVLPWHKQADALLEAAMAAAAGEASKIGTTGRGIGPCYADKATRTTAVRVVDLRGHARRRACPGGEVDRHRGEPSPQDGPRPEPPVELRQVRVARGPGTGLGFRLEGAGPDGGVDGAAGEAGQRLEVGQAPRGVEVDEDAVEVGDDEADRHG